ncbi:DUF4175 domain-containing protein [Candidatus Methylospira mobilis]|uniref:DUF4175 domain-containing protein n=1 Tax=Candidatus Methylospira mobilis TaxID=1808979 RepID=A0A5Q0BDL2_9GAMM|nr:hypothetical protein [Candidatus Methylospira mobilis]QFY41973.1 DUF4175 domain-containing protein [Candidatus Methylospira mobilis]WNV02962.1 hypothetical protein RP726_10805 [Candidatus Methylospira mobilis]
MTLIALVIGFSIVALGALGIISPAKLLGFVRGFDSLAGLYAAAAFRIVLGIALLYAAPVSHMPGLIRILGMVILAAGLVLPFIGLNRFHRIVAWWCSQGLTVIRVWAGFVFAFGLFLVYAVVT